jgi:ribonuclease P protein subunit POP4
MLEQEELIGRPCRIILSRSESQIKMEGIIVDETKQMIHIRTSSGIKMIQKRGTVFEIDGHIIHGDRIIFRPEDRIKKVRHKERGGRMHG